MLEIERKFLVKSDDFKEQAFAKNNIAQGYLSSVPERTVRVRIKGEKASFLETFFNLFFNFH